MTNRQQALFVISAPFPEGHAYASRIDSFCRLFLDIGYCVHVIADYSLGEGTPGRIYHSSSFSYQLLGSRAMRIGRNELNAICIKTVADYLQNNRPSIVFMSSNPDRFNELRDLTSKNGSRLILEQCEWFDPANYRFGKLDPRYRKLMRYIDGEYATADGIVAISRRFAAHYNENEIVRIPTILDVSNIRYNYYASNQAIHLVYAGNPGTSKELLSPIMRGILALGEMSTRIRLSIYGPNEKQVLNNSAVDKALLYATKDCVRIMGRVPQERMHDILRSADYSIFVRPDRRSSDAGFPTKLAESMAVGTPVITNNTGDIGLFLRDGYNGIILERADAEAVAAALRRIIAVDALFGNEMRRNARETAENYFDYRCYTSQLSEFLRSIIDAH